MRKIKCLMLINSFLKSSKFDEIYKLLYQACIEKNIEIVVKKNDYFLANTIQYNDFSEYDCCLFWDKDIILAKYLEDCGLRLFNCSDAIRKCDDKALTHMELMKCGIKMPKTIIAPMTYQNIGYRNMNFIEYPQDILGFPMIIKERSGSFGMQVYLVNNNEELVDVITKHINSPLLFQEFIKASKGKDIRVNMVADEFCAAMIRKSNTNDFRANVTLGGSMQTYTPNSNELDVSVKVMQCLKLDYAGVDLLFSDDGIPYVCEVNSNAHFKNILDCTGINAADMLISYIKKQVENTR